MKYTNRASTSRLAERSGNQERRLQTWESSFAASVFSIPRPIFSTLTSSPRKNTFARLKLPGFLHRIRSLAKSGSFTPKTWRKVAKNKKEVTCYFFQVLTTPSQGHPVHTASFHEETVGSVHRMLYVSEILTRTDSRT